MKTRSLLVLGVLALALLFAGCSSGGGEDYTISLADPSALSDHTGSEPLPSSDTAAKSSAGSVDTAVSAELDAAIQAAAAAAINAAATQSETFSETYNASNGGTFVISGNATYSFPDSGGSGTYSVRMNYNADVNNVKINADGDAIPTYDTTLDGQAAANYLLTLQVTENGDGSGSVVISIIGQFGWALTVSSDESGIGSGKYILLVNMSGSGSFSWDAAGNYDTSQAAGSVSVSGNLKIYDNDDTLTREVTLTESDLGSVQYIFAF